MLTGRDISWFNRTVKIICGVGSAHIRATYLNSNLPNVLQYNWNRTLEPKQQSDVWPNLSALHMAICPPRLWLPANPDQMRALHSIERVFPPTPVLHHTQSTSPKKWKCVTISTILHLAMSCNKLVILHWPSKPQNPQHTHVRYPPVINYVDSPSYPDEHVYVIWMEGMWGLLWALPTPQTILAIGLDRESRRWSFEGSFYTRN